MPTNHDPGDEDPKAWQLVSFWAYQVEALTQYQLGYDPGAAGGDYSARTTMVMGTAGESYHMAGVLSRVRPPDPVIGNEAAEWKQIQPLPEPAYDPNEFSMGCRVNTYCTICHLDRCVHLGNSDPRIAPMLMDRATWADIASEFAPPPADPAGTTDLRDFPRVFKCVFVPLRPERCDGCRGRRFQLNPDNRWQCDRCGCVYPPKDP